jgi:hypothetical protein
MHATKPKQAQPGGERPLAQSVFSGEARLRELEHLAETARKVRDQAAAELTRHGSTHHIARDRIAAAERMLRKTQQEIEELRVQTPSQGRSAAVAPAAQTNNQDFELAVMLGHSKARFNRGDTAQTALQLQQDGGNRPAKASAPRVRAGAKRPAGGSSRQPGGSPGRSLVFSILVTIGVGAGIIGTYAVANTGSISEATQLVRDQGLQLLTRLRTLMPLSAATLQPLAPQFPTSTRITATA